jgi:hypothetical protein
MQGNWSVDFGSVAVALVETAACTNILKSFIQLFKVKQGIKEIGLFLPVE